MRYNRLVPLLLLLLMSSCFLSKQKREAIHIPYQRSFEAPIYKDDIYIGTFIETANSTTSDVSSYPDTLMGLADRSIHRIENELVPGSPERQSRLEILNFYLLDRYLLPVYKNTGQKVIEERILASLVQLKETGSSAEILLQVKALHAISQGGFYYPELQEYYSSLLDDSRNITDHDKAREILSELERKDVH